MNTAVIVSSYGNKSEYRTTRGGDVQIVPNSHFFPPPSLVLQGIRCKSGAGVLNLKLSVTHSLNLVTGSSELFEDQEKKKVFDTVVFFVKTCALRLLSAGYFAAYTLWVEGPPTVVYAETQVKSRGCAF